MLMLNRQFSDAHAYKVHAFIFTLSIHNSYT